MNTLKKLRRLWNEAPKPVEARRSTRPPIVNPPEGKPPKPRQATIVRRTTARRLNYLIDHGLMEPVRITPLDECSGMPAKGLVVARRFFRQRDPVSGEITTEKIDDASPTCGV
jgi:hypothetical protein